MSVLEQAEDTAPTGLRAMLEGMGERINPVLLRDLRVYAKGKLLLSAYFLTMVALVLLAILYAVVSRNEGSDGNGLLYILTIILGEVVGALVPNLVFERFRSEFGSRATELALMSPLTPARLVRGKLMGAWCISMLVMATAMPMLATAYLLGGVNILAIIGIMAGIALAALVMPTAQLCMATQRTGRAMSRIIASVVFVGQIVIMWMYADFIHGYFVGDNFLREFWTISMLSMVVGGVLIAQFLYFVTVGRLRSEAENRDAAPRISLSAAAFVGGLTAVAIVDHFEGLRSLGGVAFWEFAGMVGCFVAYTFCLGFLLVSHSSPVPPRNLERNWADKPLRRFLLLPGMRSLGMYFLINAVIILAICLGPVMTGIDDLWDMDDEWRIACVGMAPFMAIAIGMNIYRYIVLPFVKDKRNPNLLPMTIIVGNVMVAIVAIFVMVLSAFADDTGIVHYFSAASNPVGLLYGMTMSRYRVAHVGVYGVFFLMAQFFLVLVAALSAGWRKDGRDAP